VTQAQIDSRRWRWERRTAKERRTSTTSTRTRVGSAADTEASSRAGGPIDVFIAYAREDVKFVERLYDRLVADGRSVYVDFRGIPAWSPDWEAELFSAAGSLTHTHPRAHARA
jgi:hypothetical protein